MSEPESVRVDKWLWAARFFKTRSIAQTAINGGKVHIEGRRAKTSSKILIGQQLMIRQGHDIKEIVVNELSDKRGPATTAAALYTETESSLQKRLEAANIRKLQPSTSTDHSKPNKKQRRQIIRFKTKTDQPD